MGRNKVDYTNKKIGILTPKFSFRKNNITFWHCLCDCGNEIDVKQKVLADKIGYDRSCGCIPAMPSRLRNKSKYYLRSHNNKLYNQWSNIIYRCTHSNCDNSKHYYYNGISFCEDWKDFDNFAKWSLDNGYNESLTIDRINNNLGYSPKNCRWITHAKNCRNRGISSSNKTGVAGVTIRNTKNGIKYRVVIGFNYKKIHIGYFNTLAEAAKARKEAELKYNGEININNSSIPFIDSPLP